MRAATFALMVFLAAPAVAQPPPDDAPRAEPARPRIALVLSGGGARGAAHAGVLKVLEEHRVPVDFVVGTSFGALVGGFYASGMSPDEIIAWIDELDWEFAVSDRPPRRALSFRRKQDDATYALRLEFGLRDGRLVLPRGLISANELGFRLRMRTLHSARWHSFDEMPVPFRAVATDIERGEPVVLDRGSLADAMLASMAVPGVVAPVEIDGRLLLDGGLTANLPVSVARALGADIIIAVDIATPLAPRDALADVIGVTAQVINLLGRDSVTAEIASLGPDDLLVSPDMTGISAADFELMGDAITRGLATAPDIAERLRALALPEPEWHAWVGRHRAVAQDWPLIDFIRIVNPTAIPDELIRARISQRPGEPLSRRTLRRDLDALYSLGEFERIDFELVTERGRHGLQVRVAPKDLGPHYLRVGLNIQDDLGGGGTYNLLLMSRRAQLNALNGEWRSEFQIGQTRRVSTELFQPLTARGDWFVQPRVEWSATTFDVFDAGARIGRYDLRQRSASVDGGWQFRNIGQVAVGAFAEAIDARPSIGSPGLPRADDRLAGWQWRITADQLDDWNFPADAWFVEIDGRHAGGLGGDRDFARVGFLALSAWAPTDRDRILWSVRAGARTGGSLPLYEQFALGGFLSLSGLRQGELRGEYLFQTRVIAYRRLFRLPAALGDGFYAGVSHERGNVWLDRDDAGLGDLRWGSAAFVGADLVFGALYVGVGRADNGDMSGYLYLQRSFQ